MLVMDGTSIRMPEIVVPASASTAASTDPSTAPAAATAAAALKAMCSPLTASRTSALPHGVSTRNDGRASSSSTNADTRTSPASP